MDAVNVDSRSRSEEAVRPTALPSRRLHLVLPLLCAAAYPFLLRLVPAVGALLRVSRPLSGGAIAVAVVVTLALAWGVMAVSFRAGLVLGGGSAEGPAERRARVLAHLAFAAPSLWIGFGNVAGVLHERGTLLVVWPVFWALLAAALLPARAPSGATGMDPARFRKLGAAHGASACAIILLFIAPHVANHLTGIWSGSTHIAVMGALRLLYRNEVVQPLLFTLIGFQILSGALLVRGRMKRRSDVFGTLQTMTGVYVGIFILAHVTAVVAARHAGTDTDWNWLTSNGRGMLTSLSGVGLVAHYWVGVVAVFTHVACGLRDVLLRRRVSPPGVDRLTRGLIGAGVFASSVILVALLGIHVG